MLDPLASVIMPAFNSANFIGESIDSIINQSADNWELIIVDDCSIDETENVVSKYLHDKRIKFIKNKKNLGGAISRNKAISAAQGRYIAFLDSDDLWSPHKLEHQISFMQTNNAYFSFGSYTNITEHGDKLDVIQVPAKVSFKGLLKHNYIACLTAIYDTNFFGKVYMPVVRKRHDYGLWLNLLKVTDYAYGLPSNLGCYRIRPESLSGNKLEALKFYWKVLREVGDCRIADASYNIACYLFIVLLKKKFSMLYNNLFIKSSGIQN